MAAELALFRLLNAHRGAKAVYIAPIKALVAERVRDWQRKLGSGGVGLTVVELTGDSTPDAAALRRADVIITTVRGGQLELKYLFLSTLPRDAPQPEKWDGVSRGWQQRRYVQDVSLVIIDGGGGALLARGGTHRA